MARLVYYLHDDPSAFRIELAGALSASNAPELERCWRTGSSTLGKRAFVVNLDSVTSVDDDVRRLLVRWRQLGAKLVGESAYARSVMESIAETAIAARKAASY
jgi:anti-anti-sigma regulatory factor